MEEMKIKINNDDIKFIHVFEKMSGLYQDEIVKKIFRYGIEELKTRYHFELEDFAEEFEERGMMRC